MSDSFTLQTCEDPTNSRHSLGETCSDGEAIAVFAGGANSVPPLRDRPPELFLTLRPSKLPGRSPEHVPEMTRQMALVGKARGIRNFRQREIRLSQHFLGALDSLLCEIAVRRDAGGSLKFSRKVMYRQSGDRGQRSQIYAFAQMDFHVFAYPTDRSGRQSALCLRRRRQLQKSVDRVQPRARMPSEICWIVRGAQGVMMGRRHKRRAAVVAAGKQQSRTQIGAVLAPKEVEISFENRP